MTYRLEPGTPLAEAVERARAATDVDGADEAFREAVDLAEGVIRAAIARDHVAVLLRWSDYSRALNLCTEYIDDEPEDRLLLLIRAEALCAVGDYDRAEADLDTVGSLPEVEHEARMHRLRGLIDLDRNDHDAAAKSFDKARALFESVRHIAGVAIIDRDRELLDVRRGDPRAVAEVLSAGWPRTPGEHLLLAHTLRRELRYEEALFVLDEVRDGDDALLALVREEKDLLRGLLREVPAADAVAATGADPDSPRYDKRLQHARSLVMTCRSLMAETRPAEAAIQAEQAEKRLLELRFRAKSNGEKAAWHLCAGEVELARRELLVRTEAPSTDVEPVLDQAAVHLDRAARLADTVATAEIRQLALRTLGHVHAVRGASEDADALWRDAYRIEEGIAARQVKDETKARMLLAARDEHDERTKAAAAAIGQHGMPAAAGVAVAIEAARGHTILDSMGVPRTALPRLGDLAGAYGWVRELTRDLPKSQLVWFMYADPERVHHVLVGRRVLHYHATRPRTLFRRRLATAIERLMSFWSRDNLERSVASGEFDDALAGVGTLLDIGPVLAVLPSYVTRIAVVAHGLLSHVPVAALPVPNSAERLVHRFALSDLPSLSIRRPLAHRSVHRRGGRSLLASAATDLTPAAESPGRTASLRGARARPETVRDTVPGHHIVRLDGHGAFTEDDPWLQLAPNDPSGRLRPADLESFDLGGCGTVMLGACESGMARTTGRDERIGFVRSALHAGAAAVVGARWIAEDPVAGGLLDQFERYLRYLPRDVALRRAQLDVCAGRTPHDGQPEHPARWACWTLYGDAGRQTSAGPLRRLIRAVRENRRTSAVEDKSTDGVSFLRRQ